MKPFSVFPDLGVLFFFRLSYWPKFPDNIITGSGVMTIFVYKGLTRNPEIPRLSFVQYLQIGAKLPDVTKCQIYSFHDF